jgi:hypothetical protein
MKSSRHALLLVLVVCCHTSIASANDAQLADINKIHVILPLPIIHLQHPFAFSVPESINGIVDWATTTFAAFDAQAFLEVQEEGSNFEPTIVVPGRSQTLEIMAKSDSPQWEGFPIDNIQITPLDPWISEAVVETTPPSPFARQIPMIPWIPESVFIESRVPKAFALKEVAASKKYGNFWSGQDISETLTIAQRWAQWKAWTMNDYCTAFRYISQQFARFDCSALMGKISRNDVDEKDLFELEMTLWGLD